METTQYQFESIEPCKLSSENLTAILTCLGAKTTQEDRDYILQRQNPYAQKRGGLGFGAYAVIKNPSGGTNFTNINIFATAQTAVSPLTLRITEAEVGNFVLETADRGEVTQGKILSVPLWGTRILSTGKPAITVLQQHGPRNLVGVLGLTRCALFDSENACSFCMMDGGAGNLSRTVDEIIEAFEYAKEDRSSYNLTLTTGIDASLRGADQIIGQVAQLKSRIGCTALALEIAPFDEKIEDRIARLKNAELDTIMIPLDCTSSEAQRRFVSGKAEILSRSYWKNIEVGVRSFGIGNVTSTIIVGLEPLSETLGAIDRMLMIGVIPEPVPVRWDDSKLVRQGRLPLTNPEDLIVARSRIAEKVSEYCLAEVMEKTRAGCAACGGCGGIVVNNLTRKREILKVIS